MSYRSPIAWLGAVTLLLISLAPSAAASTDFVVVVHAENSTDSLTRSEVSKIFTKRIASWDNGQKIHPVDQESQSPVREAFSEAVHHKSVNAIKSYWQRMLFSGRDVPPAEKPSDQAVLEMVRREPNAIGYVSEGASLGSGVKAIKISDLADAR